MTRHEREDKQIIFIQFFCFLIAFIISLLIPEHQTPFQYKAADALVMTGTVLLAIKLARDKWELAAAGYTLISIAWGGYFIQHEFSGGTGLGVLASSFYFFLPSMILIAFYQPFQWWIKGITLLAIVPPLIVLILASTNADNDSVGNWTGFNFKFLHFTTVVWGAHFLFKYFKEAKQARTQ